MIKLVYFKAGVNELLLKVGRHHRVCIIDAGLDLVHGSNVATLNIVLEVANLLLQLINGYLLVLDHAHDLQFVDAVSNRDKLGCAPNETVHLNLLDFLEHGIHVSLVVPGLAVEENRGLGDNSGLLGFLGMVSCEPLLPDPLGFLGLLFLIVVISSFFGHCRAVSAVLPALPM